MRSHILFLCILKLPSTDDEVVYGDSGYLGIENQDRVKEDDHLSKIDYRINKRPSSLKITDSYTGINWDKEIERRKSSVRCRVEHAFLIVKRDFGYKKTAYRGLFKNMNRFHVLFACANRLCSEFSVNARFHDKTVHILRSSEPEAEAEPPPMAARSVLDRLA